MKLFGKSQNLLSYLKHSYSNFHQNATLPKLPVPLLEQTMRKYLKAMKPILKPAQHEKLQQIVKKFAAPEGPGPKLQLYLEKRRKNLDNWAYDYWVDNMFLLNRKPLPFASNVSMVCTSRSCTTLHDVSRFAAQIIDGSLDFKESLNERILQIESTPSREKGHPLCKNQYYKLFNSCRIPQKTRDKIYSKSYTTEGIEENEHIIVACRNHFYCVPVKTADRGRLTEDEICAQIMYILDNVSCLDSPPPVGLLTALERNHWAEAYDILAQDDKNRRNLELIQNSLLIMCLDESPISYNYCKNKSTTRHFAAQRDENYISQQMFHGGGSQCNSSNRWFDKTIQIIVSTDGISAFCFEHSAADGRAMTAFRESLLVHLASRQAKSVDSVFLSPPKRLEWNLEANTLKYIQRAVHVIDRQIEDLDFQIYRFSNYGREFIKSCNLSTDSYIQLALQLTCYRLFGHLINTYEPASTRRFREGRLDGIRSATQEALDWATAMCQQHKINATNDGQLNSGKNSIFNSNIDQQRIELFNKAVQKQDEMAEHVMLGQGIDTHLLGLREAAIDTLPCTTHPLPEIFLDVSFIIAHKFLLGASQASTTGDGFTCMGAIEPDGYSISYNPKEDQIVFCITTCHSSSTPSASRFSQVLEESLYSMRELSFRVKANKVIPNCNMAT